MSPVSQRASAQISTVTGYPHKIGGTLLFSVNPSSKLFPAKAVTVGMEIHSNCRKQGKRKGDAKEMKASNANKVISVLLSVAMCPMMVPSAAFAAEDDAASGASSPNEQTQPADQAEGVDAGASSSDTIAPQSEATGEAADASTGETAAPVEGATINGYSTLEEAVQNATVDDQGVITYEVTGKVKVDGAG